MLKHGWTFTLYVKQAIQKEKNSRVVVGPPLIPALGNAFSRKAQNILLKYNLQREKYDSLDSMKNKTMGE